MDIKYMRARLTTVNLEPYKEGQLSGEANLAYQNIDTDSDDAQINSGPEDNQDLDNIRMMGIVDKINKRCVSQSPFLYKDTTDAPQPRINEVAQKILLNSLFSRQESSILLKTPYSRVLMAP